MQDESPSQPPENEPHESPAYSPLTGALQAGAAPLVKALEQASPTLGDTLTQKVAEALQTALDHSQALFDTEALELSLKKARALPYQDTPGSHEGHLASIEEAVSARRAEIQKRTVIGSCLTGFIGPVGQLADIPAFYLYAVHSLQELSLSYGFDPRLEREQKFLLQLLKIGHVPGKKSRMRQIDDLERIDLDADPATIPEISYALSGRGLTLLSRQLVKAVFQRKAFAMIPLVGAFVNASINKHLMDAILEVGQCSYRRRFVRRAQAFVADRPDRGRV